MVLVPTDRESSSESTELCSRLPTHSIFELQVMDCPRSQNQLSCPGTIYHLPVHYCYVNYQPAWVIGLTSFTSPVGRVCLPTIPLYSLCGLCWWIMKLLERSLRSSKRRKRTTQLWNIVQTGGRHAGVSYCRSHMFIGWSSDCSEHHSLFTTDWIRVTF